MSFPNASLVLACLFSVAGLAGSSQAATDSREITVLPKNVQLSALSPESGLLVQWARGDSMEEMVEAFEVQSTDPEVAVFENGKIMGRGNGECTLRVMAANGKTKSVAVVVSGFDRQPQWQFDAHVQSVLSKQGCNSGACHGALAGKGGFRLSLRAYDSSADHFTITQQDKGRRIEPADPGRSLLLSKPTLAVPHKGGQRLKAQSPDYKVLAEWISQGAPKPAASNAALEQVEVLPKTLSLKPGDRQQILVRAHYADGRIEDVTRWAKFSSSNEVVARVDESGQAAILASGKGTIVVWFASQINTCSMMVPFHGSLAQNAAEKSYDSFQTKNLIDEILLEEWKALGLTPSSTCDDATFLRRAYLDTTGSLPSPEKVLEFIASDAPNKRDQVVDQLLQSNAFVDYWSYQWSDLLLVNGTLLRPDAVAAFYGWIREQVEKNTPWDNFAKEIVLAKGSSIDQGATNFYAIHQDPESLTENTCQAFMGLSIGCAKCHNHPLEKWTNDQYYAMANLYARVRAKGWGGDSRNGDGRRTLIVLNRGDLIQPSTGKPQPPAPLDSDPIDIDDSGDRREVLARWLVSDENTYFSRSIANRIWANFMGVGLVESVDDLRVSNPASSDRLLNALAEHLIANDYDLKSLMRLILTSNAYGLSSEATDGNRDDNRFFCRYYPKRLMAEVLHDSIVSVTGVPTKFDTIEFPGADTKATDFYDDGTRSIELYDSAVANYFLKTFGRHQRRITCVCERSDQPTVVQALHLNNGDTINEKLSEESSIVQQWIDDKVSPTEIIRSAYLRTLSRLPTESETNQLATILAEVDVDEEQEASTARRELYEDLLWSLMTSKEFLFAH